MNVEKQDVSMTFRYHGPCRSSQLHSIQRGKRRWNIWLSEGGAVGAAAVAPINLRGSGWQSGCSLCLTGHTTTHTGKETNMFICCQTQNTQWNQKVKLCLTQILINLIFLQLKHLTISNGSKTPECNTKHSFILDNNLQLHIMHMKSEIPDLKK